MSFYKARNIVKEGVVSTAVAILISSFAGVLLEAKIESLLAVPSLLILVPSIADMSGNFGCMIGARIATALHLGVVRPKLERNSYLEKNVVAVLIVSIMSSMYLAFIASAASRLIGLAVEPLKILQVTLLAGISLAMVVTVIGVMVAFISFRYGWDPDNTTIPMVTAVGDVAGVAMLLLTASLVGLI
ncbi:MAG: magnesium transporter [Candidatus Nezhaarchaeota archaeon]|nr:magnesium transporter [Candidatus Nezhaarchaeota archaeon]MCX8141423.1 magnesium transporter [Candidatus Nezhaarchaeota archaeon]MDW8049689.1 magnesium transporter [Nitrososphaerota archaeon]